MAKNKKIIVIISVILLIIIGTVIGISFSKDEKGYRLIQVYEINGTAKLERENIGNMDAYENLNLLSGDLLSVLQESFLRLKMDEDKYMLVEQDSVISIYATGTDKKSKTDIHLEKGAVTVEVQNKLTEDSSFEVTTPNSVMAIRGTVFRITVDTDENGEPITKIAILEGAVTVQKKDKNGNVSEETFVSSGKEVFIYLENEEEVLIVQDEINLEEMSVETLYFLKDVVEEGRILDVSEEEIQEEIEQRELINENDELNENDISNENNELNENSTSDENDVSNENGTSDENDVSNENSTSDENNASNENNTSDENDVSNENNTSNENDSSDENGTSNENHSSNENEINKNQVYTVTFTYKGGVFGTQEVKKGEVIAEPFLQPAPLGKWDFDFQKEITEDTIIEFMEE